MCKRTPAKGVHVRVTLIYATEPELSPLKFVVDPSDAPVVIQGKVATAEVRLAGQKELAEQQGGAVSTVALTRWRSAKWIEIDLPDKPLD